MRKTGSDYSGSPRHAYKMPAPDSRIQGNTYGVPRLPRLPIEYAIAREIRMVSPD